MSTTTRTRRPSGTSARDRQRQQRRLMVLVGAIVVGLAVVIAVVSAGESGSGVRVADLAGSPDIEGELPPPPDDGADPVIDTPAPLVRGADFDGDAVVIGEPGSPQLLMFVTSWCEACRQELPLVVDWLEQGRLPQAVEFTTVVTWLDDGRPNWPPDAWLEEDGYTGRVLVDDADGSVAAAYGQPATPYWVVLDADGRVVHRSAGMVSQEQLDEFAAAVTETA